MRALVIIAGVIHAIVPEAERQMRINESDQPFSHPAIDALDLRDGRLKAAATPLPRPAPSSQIYVGGRFIDRSSA